MRDPYSLAVITASVRADRIGPTVARWFLRHLDRHTDAVVDHVDLAELNLPDDLAGGGDAERFTKRVEQADAFVVVTPEYNHGYPGPLKTAVDTPYEQWRAKPLGFVSYGGASGGLRAVEQLRNVFAELHVPTMRTSVLIPNVHDAFDDDGELRDPAPVEAALAEMVRQLNWWARTLAAARADRPYDC
ncbi:NADPH-dependent FMN reductase [Micromonospora endolithica]|uniref:NADPH-dependent oxidoreductase n=1 Tax=Micromonospora endolithica TaxID=230091 RepID=A0A3A9ZNN1_9ACTN|nr:NAD(P)H-dependent oxidoreductase [Micromonospora endolithica]RKN49126.1 NADPH-dependent oxidoreductase [Micromonospora endolithica]TWJ23282.1 NAD(P)H-dependent FMN reductase [Micromonospora endolithica]